MTGEALSTAGWVFLLGCAAAVGAVMVTREGRRVLRRIDVDVEATTRAAVAGRASTDPVRQRPPTCEVGCCTRRASVCYDSHPSGAVLWICDVHAVAARRQASSPNLTLGPLA